MSDLLFVPLDEKDLTHWLSQQRASYIAERVSAGDSEAEAAVNAEASLGRLFPGGSPARGQLVGNVTRDGVPVGTLWIGPFASDQKRWWVWDIEIHESLRGRGYGRAAMLIAEDLARSHGAETIGLNVFAQNSVARDLYSSLGYTESAVQMRKALEPSVLPAIRF